MSHAISHQLLAVPLSCSQPLVLTFFAEEDEDENLRFSPQSPYDLTHEDEDEQPR